MTTIPEINQIEGEPIEVLGLIHIKSRPYALVRWQPYGKAYVPYEFMKRYFPMMVLKHYQKQSTFRQFLDNVKSTKASKIKRRSEG